MDDDFNARPQPRRRRSPLYEDNENMNVSRDYDVIPPGSTADDNSFNARPQPRRDARRYPADDDNNLHTMDRGDMLTTLQPDGLTESARLNRLVRYRKDILNQLLINSSYIFAV